MGQLHLFIKTCGIYQKILATSIMKKVNIIKMDGVHKGIHDKYYVHLIFYTQFIVFHCQQGLTVVSYKQNS